MNKAIRIATQEDFNEFLRRPKVEWWEAAAILSGYAMPDSANTLLSNINNMPSINGYASISHILKEMKKDGLMPDYTD